MSPGRKADWRIYKDELEPLGFGDALWNPSPTDDRIPISIGDVGFIRDGRFHLLFSAGSPSEELEPGEDVPATFVPLEVGTPVFGKLRQPGCLRTPNVRQFGAPSDTTEPTVPLPEPGADFSFVLTGDHGAALVTRHRTSPEDIHPKSETAFETYIKDHYESWIDFARRKGFGNDINPVLVSGFDMTRDFSTVAYSREDDALVSPSDTPTRMFPSTPPNFQGEWRASFPPNANNGPKQPSPSSETGGAGRYSYRSSQCVFIRYYTMRLRKGFSRGSKLIRNSAVSPGAGSESDTVQNSPYEDYDSWDVLADYIFRSDPNAKRALMHHQDLADIRSMGGSGDISLILARMRPYFEVDESGVARIACKGGREFPRSDTRLGWPQGGDRLAGGNSTPIIRPPKPTLPMTQPRAPSEPLSEKPKEKRRFCCCCYCCC